MTLVDLSKPKKKAATTGQVRPAWMTSVASTWTTIDAADRRAWYWLRMRAFYLLPDLVRWVVVYFPRGFWRVTTKFASWINDQDSWELRHEAATAKDTAEWQKAHNPRKSLLHARWLVCVMLALPVVIPVLAWNYPRALSCILGALLGCLLIKIIPGRGIDEVAWGIVVWILVWVFLPDQLAKIPQPPVATWYVIAAALFLGVSAVGRPAGKSMLKRVDMVGSGVPQKPTKEMVVDALCRCGIPGMTLQQAERVHEETQVIAPGVATTPHGYVIELILQPGITAEMVVKQRAQFAAALRREIGCVWPGGDTTKHPGYLRVFISHKPMNKGRQPTWPIAAGKVIDCFEPFPLVTDEECRWIDLRFAETHAAVGGASGFGKSVLLRQIAIAFAFDPRARLVVFDGKRSGDLDCVRKLAHAYYEGAEPEDVQAQLSALRGILTERSRRAKFLSDLPRDERSAKVTSALASKYSGLSPIVVLIDECQEYTEYGVTKDEKEIRKEFLALLTKLARLGRSAAIITLYVSQKPDADVLPSAIMGNCSIRVAFKVSEQVHNDQILGTGARKSGIDSTMFTSHDRGLAWLKGGAEVDAQVVRTWSALAEDLTLADDLTEKAYAIRKARGMLTGQAAGEPEVQGDEDNLVEDVHAVMLENQCRNTSLDQLREGLALLRPGIYGHLDNLALGAMLRGAEITPKSIHCPHEGKTKVGVHIDWVTDQLPPEDGDGLTDAG